MCELFGNRKYRFPHVRKHSTESYKKVYSLNSLKFKIFNPKIYNFIILNKNNNFIIYKKIIQQKKLSHENFGKYLILKSIFGDKKKKNLFY